MSKPADAPEYVDSAEFEAKRLKSLLLKFAALVILLAAVVFGAISLRHKMRSQAPEEVAMLLKALDRIGAYRVETDALGDNGIASPLREEIHDGENWQLSLWGGKVIFTKLGKSYTTFEAGPNIEYLQSYWTGSADFSSRMRAVISASDPTNFGDRFFTKLPDRDGGASYQVSSINARYVFEIDSNGQPVRVTMSKPAENGWTPSECSSLSYKSHEITDPRKPDTKIIDVTRIPYAKERPLKSFKLSRSDHASLQRASANRSGTVFFLVSYGVLPNATIASTNGAAYGLAAEPDQGGRDSLIMAFRVDGKPAQWPLRIAVKMTCGKLPPLAFSNTLNEPDCDTIPEWCNWMAGSDQAYLDYPRCSAKVRGDYYSFLFHKGQIQSSFLNGVPAGYRVITQDRKRGLVYELQAIRDYDFLPPARQPGAPPLQTAPDELFLASAWYAVYSDLKALDSSAGKPTSEQAKRALSLAHDANKSESYQESLRDKSGADYQALITSSVESEGLGPGR